MFINVGKKSQDYHIALSAKSINSLPDDRILDLINWKAFAEDEILFSPNAFVVFVVNIVGKCLFTRFVKSSDCLVTEYFVHKSGSLSKGDHKY